MWPRGRVLFGIFHLAIFASKIHFVKSMKHESLRNKHLTIAAGYWYPYLMWACPEGGLDWKADCPNNRKYSGMLWDMLMFMKKARNFTFTLLSEGDYGWGTCYTTDNCTGMIGMVNRGEVDFALGTNYLWFLNR